MNAYKNSKEILINECERRPNLYAANVLAGILAMLGVAFLLNEIGVFTIYKALVRICFAVSLGLFVLVQLIVRRPERVVRPQVKYGIIFIVLLQVLCISVLLNIHAVLILVLPLLLATQYRSHRVSLMATAGALVCCALAPLLSYALGTFDRLFMAGFFETFCGVSLTVTLGNSISVTEAVGMIMLYWVLPQMLLLAAFGLILHSATAGNIDNVRRQLQVAELNSELSAQIKSIVDIKQRVVCSMSDIIENRDLETGGHVRRTSKIVQLLMNAMLNDPTSGVDRSFCENVIQAAPMHDLGKIAIPDTILQKPGRLTEQEYAVVRQHPIKSAQIIEQTLTGIEDEQLLMTAKNIAKYHHERVDGTGYPERRVGADIPLEARVMAIADVYDALVSERCYKAPMSFDEAFETIERSMGTQFDPALNKYFVSCRSEIESFYSA